MARSPLRPRRTTLAAAVALLLAAAIGTAVAVQGGGRAAGPARSAAPAPASRRRRAPATSSSPTSSTSSTTVPPTTVPPTTVPPTTTTTTSPGSLPQTGALPSAVTPQFDAEMAALWRGVVTGAVGPAMPAFFPEAAYLQVKTIADPAADYQDRLVAEYAADIAAAHALLGPDPASATLVGVDVPARLVHWVTPGTCANGTGYFEVPNARVVYSVGGAVRSFGIASLISWRGVWYVVHLGSVLRSGPGGVVDDPASGPGVSAPYLTC